jgi:hypothetical protein
MQINLEGRGRLNIRKTIRTQKEKIFLASEFQTSLHSLLYKAGILRIVPGIQPYEILLLKVRYESKSQRFI